MSQALTGSTRGSRDASAVLEAVLRRRPDIVERGRRVLAIAVGAALEDALARLTHLDRHLDRRHAVRANAVELPFVAESLDVIACDSERTGADAHRASRGRARMLRRGGRLIVAVAAARADAYRERLAAQGFLVALAHAGEETHVLVALRGKFAANRRPSGGLWCL